jgi:hypothetical protein
MSTRDDRRAADRAVRRAAAPGPGEAETRSVTERVASALGDAADYVESAASAVGAVVEATARRFEERPGARVRRVRRLGRIPLPYLYDVHPDARRRTPRELGVRTIDVADIAGTAVGPAGQRGSDFLPLKPFRSLNWMARWQRLGQAADKLAILPPIDVLRYGDRHWVVDGHNRVALALYRGQAAIDADVTDLVDPDRPRSDPPESFASLAEDSREIRAAVNRAASRPPSRKSPAVSDREPDPAPAPDQDPDAGPDGPR